MIKPLLCVAWVSFALLACFPSVGAEPPQVDGLVTTAGAHRLHDGNLIVRVTEHGDKLRWSVQRVADPAGAVPGKTVSRDNPPIAKGSAWFVFAPSADVVWIYDGDKGMTVIDFRKGAAAGLTNATLPAGWAEPSMGSPPKEVVVRLPAALRPKEKTKK